MRLELIGWKAWYGDGSTYHSDLSEWNEIPTRDLVVLKKFYNIYDPEGNQVSDKETGKSTFYELNYGNPVCTLSADALRKYKKLPRVIKFMNADDEVIKNYREIAEEDGEEPWLTNTTQEKTESS